MKIEKMKVNELKKYLVSNDDAKDFKEVEVYVCLNPLIINKQVLDDLGLPVAYDSVGKPFIIGKNCENEKVLNFLLEFYYSIVVESFYSFNLGYYLQDRFFVIKMNHEFNIKNKECYYQLLKKKYNDKTKWHDDFLD